MILHYCVFLYEEVQFMEPEGILAIVKAFFEAMKKILEAFGVL